MTYGENAGTIRDELTELLRQHRVLQRIGGPAAHPLPNPSTEAERAEMGRTIDRYRHAALTWCRMALDAATPSKEPPGPNTRHRPPLEDLRHWVYRTLRTPPAETRPVLELLDLQHDFELLSRWQSIGRAAALGEHDFTTNVNLGTITPDQALAVVGDAADIVRGLVVLDHRYKNIPGWRRLPWREHLNSAAEDVAGLVREQGTDLTVDVLGWRPAPAAITSPPLPGMAGALQAQHNALVDLARFPHALNLRRILLAQAKASQAAGRLAMTVSPELVERLGDRANVYRTLVSQSRNLGGIIGHGGVAVAETHNATSRLERVSAHNVSCDQLHALQRLFTLTDARLATTMERGLAEKLYFVSEVVTELVPDPTAADALPDLRRRTAWLPVTSPTQTGILPLLRERLRPPPPRVPEVPPGAQESRLALEAAIAHRPELRRLGAHSR